MNKLFIALLGAIVIVAVTADDTCTTHVANCYTCASGGTVCSECAPGYALAADKSCVECTGTQAVTCSATTPATTLTCNLGYTVNGGTTCVACALSKCAVCADSKDTCQFCMEGYTLNTATDLCADCSDAKASTCNGDTPATTVSCVSGWTLNGGSTCVGCDVSNCNTCDDKAVCDTCNPGYFKASDTSCTKCTDDCDECATASTCSVCSIDNNLLSSDKTTCTFGFKATASFALIAAAILSFVF